MDDVESGSVATGKIGTNPGRIVMFHQLDWSLVTEKETTAMQSPCFQCNGSLKTTACCQHQKLGAGNKSKADQSRFLQHFRPHSSKEQFHT